MWINVLKVLTLRLLAKVGHPHCKEAWNINNTASVERWCAEIFI